MARREVQAVLAAEAERKATLRSTTLVGNQLLSDSDDDDGEEIKVGGGGRSGGSGGGSGKGAAEGPTRRDFENMQKAMESRYEATKAELSASHKEEQLRSKREMEAQQRRIEQQDAAIKELAAKLEQRPPPPAATTAVAATPDKPPAKAKRTPRPSPPPPGYPPDVTAKPAAPTAAKQPQQTKPEPTKAAAAPTETAPPQPPPHPAGLSSSSTAAMPAASSSSFASAFAAAKPRPSRERAGSPPSSSCGLSESESASSIATVAPAAAPPKPKPPPPPPKPSSSAASSSAASAAASTSASAVAASSSSSSDVKVQTTQTVTQAFHAIDLDKSGTLSRAEIIRACREQEKVRLLLGLPRNLRESDGSMAALEAVLKKLNPSEEGVRLAEFVTVFSAPEMRAAVEAASAPPSWLSAVKDAPLFVDGEAKVRSEHGFKHFASEGRFEHTLAEWTDERIESLTSVQTELAQWRCDEKSRQTISADEYANLTKRQEEYLAANSAFPKADRDAEKAKVLANLEQRVALAYRPPSKDQMRRIKAPTSLSPPLGDISALPDQQLDPLLSSTPEQLAYAE